MKYNRFAAMFAVALTVAACAQPRQDDSMRLVTSNGNQVVLRGLIDATRTAPPERYDTRATAECATHGKTARFESMAQRSNFAFDVTYRCV